MSASIAQNREKLRRTKQEKSAERNNIAKFYSVVV